MEKLNIKCTHCKSILQINAEKLRKQFNKKVKISCPKCSGKIKFIVDADFLSQQKTNADRDFKTDIKVNTENEKLTQPALLQVFQNEFAPDQKLKLREGENVIGRASSQDMDGKVSISTSDRKMSRSHIVITVARMKDYYEYLLKDLGSTNGTFVNGNRLSEYDEVILGKRDEVTIGRTKIMLI